MVKLILAALLLLWMSVPEAGAQNYPSRPVTVIVPFAAGGPSDVSARIIAEQFSRLLGQQFVIENVGGAGGTTGATRGARATPDGYTIMIGHMGTHAAAPALYPNLAYKPDEDFEPIGLIAEYPMLLVTRRDFAPNTMREFIEYAKANEAKLNMAHAGVGSVSYTGCVLLHAALGIKPTMVPFTGSGPAMNALVASQVDYVCDPIAGALGHVRAGSVKPLAIATSKRHPALPDVPTAAESGLSGFAAAPFYAMFAPRGTPQPIVDRLAGALNAALDDDAVRKRLIDLGGEIPEAGRRGPKPLAELVRSEMTRLAPILKGGQ